MAELRFNPLLGTWTMVSGNRQKRPNLQEGDCPFCPGSGKVPEHYDVHCYGNDFPVLSTEPDAPVRPGGDGASPGEGFYRAGEAYGKCDVVLYTPEHEKSLHELPAEHITKLVRLWMDRTRDLSADRKIQCVFPFENRGDAAGATMRHPHGQIYAFPFVPLKLKAELDNCARYYSENGRCLICEMNRAELESGKRLLYENGGFLAYVPYFTDYPYGVFITPKTHLAGLDGLDGPGAAALADALKTVTGSFDSLFNMPFPYMMVVHQAPVNSPGYAGSEKYFHFHIEFYPPMRDRGRIKYYASAELGMWAAANVAPVESSVLDLRAAKLRRISCWADGKKLREELEREFNGVYGPGGGPVRFFSAPGRVNIIGEHIDYNGGLVFPAAISLENRLLVRLRDDRQARLYSVNYPGVYGFSLEGPIARDAAVEWVNYPLGVLGALKERGKFPSGGFDALFFSDIPPGSGLSSSAALEMAFASAMDRLFGLGLGARELAVLCRRAENEFAGVQCGIMDQFASGMGRKGCGILLDCAALSYEYVPLDLGGHRLVIIHTGKKRALSDTPYNRRLGECRRALEVLSGPFGIKDLCSLKTADLEKAGAKLKDETLFKRVRHCVTEQLRVTRSAEALKKGDLKALGILMNESHVSLRDDYEATGPELDALFDIVSGLGYCAGSRMTGAGFGGCFISLVPAGRTGQFMKDVAGPYNAKTGLTPEFFICETADGAREWLE